MSVSHDYVYLNGTFTYPNGHMQTTVIECHLDGNHDMVDAERALHATDGCAEHCLGDRGVNELVAAFCADPCGLWTVVEGDDTTNRLVVPLRSAVLAIGALELLEKHGGVS